MGDASGLDGPDLLQQDIGADALEQAGAGAQHERDDAQLELVYEYNGQGLVDA